MGKKQKKALIKSSLNKRELTDMVKSFISGRPGEAFTLKQFFSALKLTSHPLRMLCVDILNELLDDNYITRNHEGEILFNGTAHTAEGTFKRTPGGRNFVDTDDGVGISIYDEDTRHAMPGDRVRVSIHAKRRGSTKLHGEVYRRAGGYRHAVVLRLHAQVLSHLLPASIHHRSAHLLLILTQNSYTKKNGLAIC